MSRHFTRANNADRVFIGNPSATNLASNFTLACWFWLDSVSNIMRIIAKWDDANGGAGVLQYELAFDSAAKNIFFALGNGASVAGTLDGATVLTSGQWYHGAATLNGTTAMTVYLNGVSDGTANTSFAPATSTAALVVGAGANTGGSPAFDNFFDGRLADCAIWSAVLTAGEIKALSQGALPFNVRPGSLVGYWPLDGLQSPEPDLSGNANNGTLTGTTLAAGPPVALFTPRWPLNSVSVTSSSTGASFLAAWALGQRMFGDGIGV